MKEENYPTGAFVAFVLLSQNEWDIKKLINDCKADWNIEIPYDGNEEALVAVMGDVTLAVAIMPAPVPNQEAEHYAGANYMWKDAVEVTKSHKAHLMVSVLGKDANLLECAGIYTYGMRKFGKEEMEVYAANADLNDVRDFLLDIVTYVLDYDVTLNDGETIGFSEEQKLRITLSDAVALDGKSLKLEYPQ